VDETKRPQLAPPVRMLAETPLRHYATASGERTSARPRAPSSRTTTRRWRCGRAVIPDALAESHARGIEHPPLAYVFSAQHVQRRLERLAEAEHLAQKTTDGGAGGDMFAAGFDGALADVRAPSLRPVSSQRRSSARVPSFGVYEAEPVVTLRAPV
jgi:hypothetical protein